MPNVLSHPAHLNTSKGATAELDLLYAHSAPLHATWFQGCRQWFYNYVLPVLAILALPVLVLPLVVTFILACARMQHGEPDSELYGSEPVNGPIKLEDPCGDAVTLAVDSPAATLPYRWN